MSERLQRNQYVIDEFRATGGKMGGGGLPLLLLTTTGAHSKKRHTMPMAYTTDGSRLVVFAANGGRPSNPGWYYNLIADPSATAEVGTDEWQVTAEITEGDERERLWTEQVQRAPFFADFQQRAGRPIPVIVLTRVET